MGKKRVLISYGVDVDAVAGWLGSYGGEDSTNDISRGKQPLNQGVRGPNDADACHEKDFSPAQSVCDEC